MKKITEYEIISHGIDHAQYFQGCGVSFTKYSHVVTGCGEDEKSAFDDALDSIAQNGVETETLEKSEEYKYLEENAETLQTVTQFVESQGETVGDECELYFYLSVRYNFEGEDAK